MTCVSRSSYSATALAALAVEGLVGGGGGGGGGVVMNGGGSRETCCSS